MKISPQKLKRNKLKEKKKRESLEIVKEEKTPDTMKEERKSGLDLKRKRKKGNLGATDEISSRGEDTVDSMNLEKKTKKKKKSKLGLKIKERVKKGNDVDLSFDNDQVTNLSINVCEDLGQAHKRVEKEKKRKPGLKMKKRTGKADGVDASSEGQTHADENGEDEKMHLNINVCEDLGEEHKRVEKEKKRKLGLKKKRRTGKADGVDASSEGQTHANENGEDETMHLDGIDPEELDQRCIRPKKEKKSKLGLKKKKTKKKAKETGGSNEDQIQADDHVDNNGTMCSGSRCESDHAQRLTDSQTLNASGNSENPEQSSNGTKTKKMKRRKQKDFDVAKKRKLEKMHGAMDAEKVEEIQTVDEDCSRGMKKWLIKYKESRPGLKILQERIDDFITEYEERQEQERKEREAQAAEGGWTVVAHHKGRKKTTDAETGVTVGSVAQAAVLDKMGQKKSKEAPLDFYRFQRREAKRNEVMMLQSKFEQDKKRIQQLRAARKFRPY